MTVKNYPQLIASFPDNNNGSISPLNLRDFVASTELKYDNWTVVKPGNIEGNKFPDPDAGDGKIYLPDGTTWVINGAVTVTAAAIVYGNNVTIIGLTGDFFKDQLILDASITGGSLLEDTVGNNNLTVIGLALGSFSASSVILNVENTQNVVFTDVILLGEDPGHVNEAANVLIDNLVVLSASTPLSFLGADTIFTISRARDIDGGFAPTGNVFALYGTYKQITIDNCTKFADAATSLFYVDGGVVADRAIVSNCTMIEGILGSFISGVTATNVYWTFSGNSGLANSRPGGGVIVSANATTTVNPGSGVYAPVNATGALTTNTQRFTRPTRCRMLYSGIEEFNGTIMITGNARRASGSADVSGNISLLKNGVLFTDGGFWARVGITLNNGNRPFALTVPVSLVTNDYFEAGISLVSGAIDTIIEDLQISIG